MPRFFFSALFHRPRKRRRRRPRKRRSRPKRSAFKARPNIRKRSLLAAAGLKPDARLNAKDVKAHAKQLNDTGFFAVVRFSNDSKGLLFSLTPSNQLFPMHLDNLPLKPGKELDDKLHARFPLYHSLLPANGSTLEGIRQSFEEMLAAQGVKATVKAAVTSGLGPKKITAMNFTVTSPAVRIGPIQLAGVSAAMQAKVDSLVNGQTGNEFDTENSTIGLKHAFEDLYQDQGYAAVEVDVAQIDPPIISGQSSDQPSDLAVEIPYSVTVREGGVYKLGTISYPADAAVSRAEVAKILSKYPAGSGRPLDLFLLAVRDAYHAKGYLDCSIFPQASFNEATHIVNYSLETAPGPLYRMAAVQFDGAPAAMAARLTRLWKMAPGDVFDDSYVSGFAARAQKQDRALAKWMQTVVTTFDVKADPTTHQVNCIFHFAKPAQGVH